MGCIQAKPNSPSRGLEKLQASHGYFVKSRVEGKREKALVIEPETKIVKTSSVVVVDGGNERHKDDDGDDDLKAEDAKKKKNKKKKKRVINGGDEDVDGWPKWLVDNIPQEILAAFVPRSADSYDKLDKIGHGTYSNVYKARDRETKKIVALKKVRFDTSEPESIKFMAREITILQKLDHPNVLKLQGLATSRMQCSLYLVFDFMQADLHKVISCSEQKLNESQVKCYMQQLLLGLQHCHKCGILHRDIKSSNLLVDKSGTLKIADFGLATVFPPKQKRPLTSRVVTLWYRAPELLLGSTDYGVGIDLWSAGCLLAEMFIGKPFMPGRTEVEQLHKIFKLCGAPRDEFWKRMRLPTSFRPPQHYEPSFEEAFKEFPSSSFRLLTQLLALDPASRGTAASALQTDFFSTSPLACDISALPVINTEEDEPSRMKNKNKQRSSKAKKSSNKQKETLYEVNRDYLLPKFNQENSESNIAISQEMGSSNNSTSTSSSQNKQTSNNNVSLSPILGSNPNNHNNIINRFSRTEAHPYALKNINPDVLKNIKNFTLLQASVTDIINHKEGSALAHYFRSLSALDFRNRDDNDNKNTSKSFESEKD